MHPFARCCKGADAVVNCVGILGEVGKNRFDAVQADGAGRIARIAAEQGIATMVHISAIGADAKSDSLYQRSKAEGEALVQAAMPGAVILRPSVVFGTEDQFFNRFAGMARFSPFLPVVGAKTRFQPVYVDDVAAAAELALTQGAAPGIYELGGPDVASFRDLMVQMLAEIRRKRVLVHVPFFAAKIMGTIFDILQKISFGLFTNGVLTRDQVRNLARDNVVSKDARGFVELGLTPTPNVGDPAGLPVCLPGWWPIQGDPRIRRAFAQRLGRRAPNRRAASGFRRGTSTLSTTWITPFDWFTSLMVTRPALPDSS